MLITFSKDLSLDFNPGGDWRYQAVEGAARLALTQANVKWARYDDSSKVHRVRFTLPGATFRQHDLCINALFGIDPWAKIETARALYEGADDFLAQKAARVPA